MRLSEWKFRKKYIDSYRQKFEMFLSDESNLKEYRLHKSLHDLSDKDIEFLQGLPCSRKKITKSRGKKLLVNIRLLEVELKNLLKSKKITRAYSESIYEKCLDVLNLKYYIPSRIRWVKSLSKKDFIEVISSEIWDSKKSIPQDKDEIVYCLDDKKIIASPYRDEDILRDMSSEIIRLITPFKVWRTKIPSNGKSNWFRDYLDVDDLLRKHSVGLLSILYMDRVEYVNPKRFIESDNINVKIKSLKFLSNKELVDIIINHEDIYKEASDLYRERDLPYSNYELRLIQKGKLPNFSSEKLFRFIPPNKRKRWYYEYSINMIEKESSVKNTNNFILFQPFSIESDIHNDFYYNMCFFLSTLSKKDILTKFMHLIGRSDLKHVFENIIGE